MVLLVLFAILLARTTGIHADEAGYLGFAVSTPEGDSGGTGKAVLAHFLNYGIYHGAGQYLGRLRPISLHLFYLLFFAAATWPAAHRRLIAALALALSPLIALNATQLMMESAIFPALIAAFALADRDEQGGRGCLAWLFAASVLAATLKITAAPALLVLAAAVFSRARRRSLAILLGVAFGLLTNLLLVKFLVHPLTTFDYGGVDRLFRGDTIRAHLAMTGEYVYAWLFLGGLVGILGALLAWRSGDPRRRETAAIVGGSLLACFAIQLVSRFNFIRYAYPAILIALLCGVSSFLRAGRAAARPFAILAAISLVFSSALFRKDANRFRGWPHLVVFELIESGGTTLQGFPVHAWELFEKVPPCIEFSGDDQAVSFLAGYYSWVYPRTPQRTACTEPSALRIQRNWREWREGSSDPCPSGCFCAVQPVSFYSYREGWRETRVCR
ncbi:MAG: hypothetical protein ACXWP5_10510 [Bdellovibrionota bacterium]